MYTIKFTRQAVKDIEKLKPSGLSSKAKRLIEIIKANPPSYEKLVEDLAGLYSRRLNIQHRLVYEVFEEEKIVKILSMWTHYE